MSNQASSSRVSRINKTGSTPLIGAVTLTGGTNVTLTQTGQDISIAATGGGGTGDMLAATYDPAGVAQQLVGQTATQTITNKVITSGKFNNLNDTSGNIQLLLTPVASAVNYITVKNAATGTAVSLTATGTDTDISLNLKSAGVGVIIANGLPVVTTTDTQTLSGKTLTTPTINGPTLNTSGAAGGITVVNPTIAVYGLKSSSTNVLSMQGTNGSESVRILDSNDKTIITTTNGVTSPVNYHEFTPSATTAALTLNAKGTDTNISYNIVPKGTGRLQAGGVNVPTISSTDTFTNKTYDTAGTGNSFSINGVAVTANSGTGAVLRTTNPALTTPTITWTNNTVTAASLATNAISLMTPITSSTTQTGITSTPVLVTNLSATVTVPAGGRSVRIEAQCPYFFSTTAATWSLYIYNSATVTGSPIQTTSILQAISSAILGGSIWFEHTPVAGSQSYCIAISCDNGTGVTTGVSATRLNTMSIKVV